MVIENDWPRAHLLVDEFFSPSALETIFTELPSLDRHMKPGLVRDIGHDGQSVFFEHRRRRNKAVWIRDPSKILHLFREHLWSDVMLESFEHAREPLFQIIPNCWAPHLQVSSYMTGDHYDFHEDEGAGVNLTAIVFLATDPKKVHGGDLVLAYDNDETKIRFRQNRLVIFPSKTLHRVTRVRVDSTNVRHARITLQCWLTYGRPPTKPSRASKSSKPSKPSKRKRRAAEAEAEADRATFLLAEPSILAAAQAMGDSNSKTTRDQSPEDLYWGAFYLSRILTSNLRSLVAEQYALEIGRIRIRRAAGDDTLEVFARGHFAAFRDASLPVRVGFTLRGTQTPTSQALSLFVETGRGKTKATSRRVVPLGASEHETGAILQRLLHRLQ